MANPNDVGCIDFQDCSFSYDASAKEYVLTGPFGERCVAPANVTAQLLSPDVNGQCYLQMEFNGINCGRVNLTPLLDKVLTPDVPPLGITFDPGPCELVIQYSQLVSPMRIPLSAILDKVKVGLTYDDVNCILTFVDQHCNVTNMNIGASILAKVPRPTLTKDVLPDGTQVLNWSNGWGQNGICTIPAVALDVDGGQLSSDGVLTLNWGGDGNPGNLVVDICAIVGANCNSYFTQITPTSWTYVDNNGVEQVWNAPELPILQNKNGQPLAAGNSYQLMQQSDFISTGVEAPTNQGIQLLAFGPNGQCVTYQVPEIPPGLTKEEVVADFTQVQTIPSDAEVLFVGPNGLCRRAPLPAIPEVSPEVFIGTTQPAKSEGYLVWFNPVTCVVRYCDNNGNWFEPRNVVCSPDAPDCEKGEADIWFNTVEGCLYVCCDGVWISSDTAAIRSVIDKLCIQIGSDAPQDLIVVDGKVVIPIPAPVTLPRYCVQVGSGQEIFGQETADNKFRFNLPAYPEFFETCLRLNNADIIAPHLEDNKYFLDIDLPTKEDIVGEFAPIGGTIPVGQASFLYVDAQGNCRQGALPPYPVIPDPVDIPELPTVKSGTANVDVDVTVGPNEEPCYAISVTPQDLPPFPELPTVKAGSSNVDIEETAGPNGEPCYAISVGTQDIPPLPNFCVEDKSGNRIDATIESGKIVINLPPITACQSNEPATDGSEGCFWFDGSCLHVLCDGTWISADASATQE